MAGEAITVLRGPVRTIRPVAAADAAAGDVTIACLTAGFWLADVKKGETGELCIEAGLVSVKNDKKAHKAGELVDVTAAGLAYLATPKQAKNDTTPRAAGVVFSNAKRSDDRVLVVWGYR